MDNEIEKVVIFDTNFLISNLKNLSSIMTKLKENRCILYLPQIVKEEVINNRIREIYKFYEELKELKYKNKLFEIKFKPASDIIKIEEKGYNDSFTKYFDNNIIKYEDEIFPQILQRDKYKKPPFCNEDNSSDKGFKDTIIVLSIIEFFKQYKSETKIYFITNDKVFSKYKTQIEEEILFSTSKDFEIILTDNKEKLYSSLQIETEKQEENIFALQDNVNIDEIREDINSLMYDFNMAFDDEYTGFGDPHYLRYEITEEINEQNTEYLLEDLKDVIKNNVFNISISLKELAFKNIIIEHCQIEMDILKKINNLYLKVKNTQYKEAFVNFIMQKINENKVPITINTDNSDELPF